MVNPISGGEPLSHLSEPFADPAPRCITDCAPQSRSGEGDVRSPLAELVSLHGRALDLRAGETLWREGDIGNEVAVISAGSLEVVVGSPQDTVLRTLGPGAVIGEMACIDGQPRSATIRASCDSRLYCCADDVFRNLLRKRPDILEALLLQQIARVRSLTGAVSTTHRQAITDGLTGLYNVGFLMERLHLEVERARQTGGKVCLVMLDVDHFKRFNDTNGHQAGNVVLAGIAEQLQKVVRRGDIVARYGGEELALLLYGAEREDGLRLAEQARESIRCQEFPGRESQPDGRVTVSIGVAVFPEDAVDFPGLIEVADERMYRAKRGGRDRTVAS